MPREEIVHDHPMLALVHTAQRLKWGPYTRSFGLRAPIRAVVGTIGLANSLNAPLGANFHALPTTPLK
jgi:hypothetical protein